VPSIAATARDRSNSSRTSLASAATSSRLSPIALLRSCRDKPDPFSSTRPGIASLRAASQRFTTFTALAGVAGGVSLAVASVRKIWRAITLFDSLLTSRTMSASGGDSSTANGAVPAGTRRSVTLPSKRPPAARKYVANIART